MLTFKKADRGRSGNRGPEMIVVHAGLSGGRFLLWGETPVSAPGRPPSRRGRKPNAPRPQSLPGHAGGDALNAVLQETPGRSTRQPAEIVHAFLWLPTAAGRPVASSPLIAEPPHAATAVALTPWVVAVLPLSPAEAIDLLGACLDRQTLAPGVVVGPTLAFWAAALRFAGALTAREQFLPDIAPIGKTWRAGWKPVLTGPEAERCGRLARAMPGACRAFTDRADAPPDRPAAAVLADFLGIMVDALVRAATAGSGVAVPARLRRQEGADV